MHSIRTFLVLFLFVIGMHSLHAISIPDQDKELVHVLQGKQIRLIVIRHAEATHNLLDYLTSSDTPGIYLTEKGELEAQAAADRLAGETIDAFYISPIYRSLQTAQLLMKHLQMPPCKGIVDRRLREQFFGSFLGLTFQDYRNYFSSKEEMYTYAVPGGEPGINVFRRGRDLLWDIAYRHSCETVVLVTHGLNCCQINKCLKGSYGEIPALGRPRLYDFNEDLQECDLTYALDDQIE